jgi:hypothetical protein
VEALARTDEARSMTTARHTPNYVGCDELREWLTANGFRIAPDSFARDNGCNWYACRRSAITARECECNDGKPMQIVVRPFWLKHDSAPGGAWESAEVDVTGEAGGHWYALKCYSLKHDELKGRLHEIEAALIAAWNALRPIQGAGDAE